MKKSKTEYVNHVEKHVSMVINQKMYNLTHYQRTKNISTLHSSYCARDCENYKTLHFYLFCKTNHYIGSSGQVDKWNLVPEYILVKNEGLMSNLSVTRFTCSPHIEWFLENFTKHINCCGTCT